MELAGVAHLDDLAGVHDEHTVTERRNQMQVVADQDQPHAAAFHHLVHNRQNLLLDGDVKRGGWLVGDQDVGASDQHHGDHDALAHATGELMRILVVDPLGVPDMHGFEHFERGLARFGLAAAKMVSVGLGDLLAD